MTVDPNLRETFLQETRQHLEAMEQELLSIVASGHATPDEVAVLFRAAHSIKGSANAFSLQEVARVTHALETWLDGVREGRLVLGSCSARILLEFVDELGSSIDTVEAEDCNSLSRAFELVAGLPGGESDIEANENEKVRSEPSRRFSIDLTFCVDALSCGVEPLGLLRALSELGTVEVTADSQRLPELADIDTLSTYLRFVIVLSTDATEEDVTSLLDWGEAIEHLDVREVRSTPRKSDRRRPSDRSIRVATEKLDELMALVGELVMTQSRVVNFGRRLPAALEDEFATVVSELDMAVRQVQEAAMQVRMVPVAVLTTRFPRIVADVSHQLGKQVRLEISGERTEVDKQVAEAMVDPIQHLLRNAIDHGIEEPAVRAARGKAAQGLIAIDVRQRDGAVELEVHDDGGGVDRQAVCNKAKRLGLVAEEAQLGERETLDLLFAPGLSTARSITDVSGRGVGMDVVRQNVEAMGGNISVSSLEGQGTTFVIRFPLTTAILDGQLVRCGDSTLVLPLASVRELVRFDRAPIRRLPAGVRLLRYQDEDIPLVELARALELRNRADAPRVIVVVECKEDVIALAVDEALDQRQVVVKSLVQHYGSAEGVSAVTVLGDGRVAPIVDVSGIAGAIGARRGRTAA